MTSLLERLWEDGTLGCDGSPGYALSKEAHDRLKLLEDLVDHMSDELTKCGRRDLHTPHLERLREAQGSRV